MYSKFGMIWSDVIFQKCCMFFFILHFQGQQSNPEFFEYFYDFFQIFHYLMRSSFIFRPISFLGNFDVPELASTSLWLFLNSPVVSSTLHELLLPTYGITHLMVLPNYGNTQLR